MKKLVAMLLALAMLLSISAIAEAPEGYPEVVPGIDYEGKTIYIYAWYDQKRAEEPTEEEQARYDYEDWLMETYNVKIEYVYKYEWGTAIEELINFTGNPDPSLWCLFTIPGDYTHTALSNKLFAPLNGSKLYQGALTAMDDASVTITVENEEIAFERKAVAIIKPVLDLDVDDFADAEFGEEE